MSRSAPIASRFALRFFFAAVAVFCASGALATGLIRFGPAAATSRVLLVPPAFWLSTFLLWTGSFALGRALTFVRAEKQRPFRRNMIVATAAATLFVAVQSYALWGLLHRPASDAPHVATGSTAFIFVLAGLHVLHVSVAILFLVFVTLRSRIDRYDHEYYWGVTVCTYFWHLLGLAWLAILAVLIIAG